MKGIRLMGTNYKKQEEIFSISGEKGFYDIELNIIKWHDNRPKYDLRRWESGVPQKNGFTLEKSELKELYDMLKDYYEPKKEDVESISEIDDSKEEQIIDFRQFVVIDSVTSCIRKNHNISKVRAKVPIYRSFKDEVVLIEAEDTYYCEDCKAYYIEEACYEGLKMLGRIMCSVFNRQTFDEFVKNGRSFIQDDLAAESKLKVIGYNAQSGGPNDKERRKILEYAYLSGYMSKKEIVSFLSWLIKMREKQPNMEAAVRKWKADRNWILGIRISNEIPVGIKTIITND